MENNIIVKEGISYVLRNGLVTSPLKFSKNRTNYYYEGNVKEPEHVNESVFHWKKNGKFLTDSINNRFDIIKENKIMITKEEINSLPLDQMGIELKKITIIEKIIFSDISKEEIKYKIKDLRENQVPNRTVFLEKDSEEIVFYWFQNWLHPKLKHIIKKSPRSKVGCSQKVIENDAKKDFLNFYENGQQNFKYTLEEIENWCNEK